MRYKPRSSVTDVRTFSMSTGLAASTVTPGSEAPDASFAEPAMDACAKAAAGRLNSGVGSALRRPRCVAVAYAKAL